MPIHGYPGNIITANTPTPSVSSASGVWTTEQQLQNMTAGNWPMAATQISRSLRFNSADSAYLDRTLGTPTNGKIFTFSVWLKRSILGTLQSIMTAQNGGAEDSFAFLSGDTIRLFFSAYSSSGLTTNAVFRDVSAWYHIVLAVDTTQATASNRVKMYVNGVEQTFTGSNYPSQNATPFFNTALQHFIGRYANQTMPAGNFNGYMTEINFIDGLALTPASFGQTNSSTGVWGPRQYTGPYGTNGFYINFSDNSGTTSTTLGKDYSGRGNNWTPNNFSVTAGAGNDSLVDSPTQYGTDTGAGGEVRGNYATWNPIYTIPSNTTTSFTNGNLDFSVTQAEGTGTASAVTTMPLPTTGKWYWEITPTTVATLAASRTQIGVMGKAQINFGLGNNADCFAYTAAGGSVSKVTNATFTSYGNSYTANDVIGVAVDLDNGAIYFAKNGTWQNSGVPTSGASKTGAAFTTLVGANEYFPAVGYWGTFVANFGQRPFAYTAPSGFKALCTTNLPTPTIGATATTRADDYFNTVLYTGNSTARSITGVGFSPDFTWIKRRDVADDHYLFDSVRTATKYLSSNLTTAETTNAFSLTSFDSDGFSLGTSSTVNSNTNTFVSWNWNAGGSSATNTSGTITSTVRANTTAGFSIVTYTGTGANATVGHGLGVAPYMIIIKRRDTTGTWRVGHSSLTSWAYRLNLDETADAAINAGAFNSTAPTSTVFSVGTDTSTNASTGTYVAYCFAPVAGYSAFGKYTGNGSTDGPMVYTGFRPACIILKVSDGTANWLIHDNKRNTYNVVDKKLFPNANDAEATADVADFLSNGFKLKGTNTQFNGNGYNYIYAAFAEFPFKYTLAR
jgi:hypothetical protein